MKKVVKKTAKRATPKKLAAKRAPKQKGVLLLINRSSATVAPKKAASKARKAAPAPARVKQYKHCIEVRKTAAGKWAPVGMAGNDVEGLKKVARMYASNYPSYAFRVI
ncbi:MAG TPA: hypothetical protein VJ577_11395 [Burkholderiaceae bacterium]|nr:hypothetical protein [Burkholderiaceae bacterium]